MKHLTRTQAKEMHYIPANNVFAFYLTGGQEGAAAEIICVSAEMDRLATADDTCSACRLALQQWYQRSCHLVLKDLVAGEKPNQNYPPLVSLCWAEQ